ncbi:MAG: hypothetical protein ACI9LY_000707 [Arenicella sp.]|jgi:hypothetical protein
MASKLKQALIKALQIPDASDDEKALQIPDASDDEYEAIVKELNLGCEIGDWKEFCIELQKELTADCEHPLSNLEKQYKL